MSGETSDHKRPSAEFLYLTLMSVRDRCTMRSRFAHSTARRCPTDWRAETIRVSRCSGGRRTGGGAVDCSVTARLVGDGLRGVPRDHRVDEAVLLGLLGGEPPVPVRVRLDALDRLAGVE